MTPPADEGATRWLRRLALFVVIASSFEFLIATTGVQIQRLPPSTDFATYYLAGALAQDGESPYDRATLAARGRSLGFQHDQFPFLYPPPFALAMQPLARLSYARARAVWMVLSTLGLFAALGITARLAWRQAWALGIEDRRRVWLLLAAFVPAALNSTSVHNDIRAGSVGIFLYLALAVAALALFERGSALMTPGAARRPGRDLAAGVALAVATLVKLVPAAFLPWVAARGARRAAGWACLGLVLAMVPAIAHWGPGIVADYLRRAIGPALVAEVAPPMNQSLDAFLARVLLQTEWTTPPVELPTLKRVLSIVLGMIVAGSTVRALAVRRRPPALQPVEMGFLLLALLVLLKLTWVQTLCAMLWVWPVLMLAILRAAERGAPWARRAGLGACLGFFLSSAHIPILWTGLRHGWPVLVTGVHLAGLLVLWEVSRRVLQRAVHEPRFFAPE